MPPNDALFPAAVAAPAIADAEIALRIGLSVLTGTVVGVLYYFTLGRRKREGLAMPLTLVLLSLLVCMVTLIVNSNIALAFTLGGTLAIVRFRTVVEDTRDTAFVIAAVVVGMGMGTASNAVVQVGLPVFVFVVAVATALAPGGPSGGLKVVLRVAHDRDPEELTRAAFASCEVQPLLIALETAKQGTAIEVIYTVKKLDSAGMLKLIAALRAVEGVQGVEVKPM